MTWTENGTEIIARILLIGRRRSTVRLNGTYWRLCQHPPHAGDKACSQWSVYDGYCHFHNASCWSSCDR